MTALPCPALPCPPTHPHALPASLPSPLRASTSAPARVQAFGERAEEWLGSLARAYHGTVFFVSLGPMSEAVILTMWRANPTNMYVDVGSGLDLFVKGVPTRSYQTAERGAIKHICDPLR